MMIKHKRITWSRGVLCGWSQATKNYTQRRNSTVDHGVNFCFNHCHECDMDVTDLPGAYMDVSINGEEEVLMTLRGKLAELMVLTAPTFTTSMLLWTRMTTRF